MTGKQITRITFLKKTVCNRWMNRSYQYSINNSFCDCYWAQSDHVACNCGWERAEFQCWLLSGNYSDGGSSWSGWMSARKNRSDSQCQVRVLSGNSANHWIKSSDGNSFFFVLFFNRYSLSYLIRRPPMFSPTSTSRSWPNSPDVSCKKFGILSNPKTRSSNVSPKIFTELLLMINSSVQLSPCEVEVDISIVDRITALFNRPSFLNNPKSRFSQMYQVFISKCAFQWVEYSVDWLFRRSSPP